MGDYAKTTSRTNAQPEESEPPVTAAQERAAKMVDLAISV
jgi:hypothetical protein